MGGAPLPGPAAAEASSGRERGRLRLDDRTISGSCIRRSLHFLIPISSVLV